MTFTRFFIWTSVGKMCVSWSDKHYRFATIVFAVSLRIRWHQAQLKIQKWRTDTEGSLAAAVEEMTAGYDQLMLPVIENIPMLIVVLLLTIPVAILAMRLAERVMKKSAALLK